MEDDTARQIIQEMEATSERHRLIVAHLRSQVIQWKNIAGGLAECLVEQMDDPRSDNAFHIKKIHDYARALKYDGGEFDSAIHLGEFLNKMEL
jgi:hypothetical protein